MPLNWFQPNLAQKHWWVTGQRVSCIERPEACSIEWVMATLVKISYTCYTNFRWPFFQWKINRKLWNKGCMLKIFSNSTLNKIENIPSKDIKGYNIRDWYKSKIFRAQKFQGLSIVLVGVVGGSVLIQKGNMQIKYALAHRSIFTSLFMS